MGKSAKQGVAFILFLIRDVVTFREATTQVDNFSVRPVGRGQKALPKLSYFYPAAEDLFAGSLSEPCSVGVI